MLPSAESKNDLSVLRFTVYFSYYEYCINIIRRDSRTSVYILLTFVSCNATFMSHMFIAYGRLMLFYVCQLKSPHAIELINHVERVQRLFTRLVRAIYSTFV